jgi:transcriptional regulator with XRE-family HTH domain
MSSPNVTGSKIPTWTLGDRLRKAREELGMSQQQLADALGVDRKSISSWEVGRHQPRYRDVSAIAGATGVDLEWLAGDRYRRLAAVATHDGVRGDTARYSRWETRATSDESSLSVAA